MNANEVAETFSREMVIAYPTEYCFGIGCLVSNEVGLERIRTIKNRPQASAFIIIGATIAQFKPYTKGVSDSEWQYLEGIWPAATTFLVPAAPSVSKLLVGDSGEIALRIPDHALARELCTAAQGAIVSTSANRRGAPPLKTADEVRRQFGDELDWVVDAPCGEYNKPSTIIRLADHHVVRA